MKNGLLTCYFGLAALFSVAFQAQPASSMTTEDEDILKYPQLSSLCLAASKLGQTALSFGTALIDGREIFEIQLNCGVGIDPADSSKATTYLTIEPVRSINSEGQSFTIKEKVQNVDLAMNKVKGKSELILSVHGFKTATVVRYILDLNSDGQPVVQRNDFTGIVDHSKLVRRGEDSAPFRSGLYTFHADENDVSVMCSIKSRSSDGAEELNECKSERSKGYTVPVGPSLTSSLVTSFGWWADKQPTNQDLNRLQGRVNFQISLTELASLIQNKYTRSADFQAHVKKAKEALANR